MDMTTTADMINTEYNGWKNRATWALNLHFNNDYDMYTGHLAVATNLLDVWPTYAEACKAMEHYYRSTLEIVLATCRAAATQRERSLGQHDFALLLFGDIAFAYDAEDITKELVRRSMNTLGDLVTVDLFESTLWDLDELVAGIDWVTLAEYAIDDANEIKESN